MGRRWLILDVPNIVWRNQHVLGFLKHDDMDTGATFGFLRDLVSLRKTHATPDVAFCFDVGRSLRREAYPNYKASRRTKYAEATEDECDSRDQVKRQLTDLRMNHLPEIGFRNVFWAKGFEADDVIASLCIHTLKPRDTAVLVSTDKDLYQLLAPSVAIWDSARKDVVTDKSFAKLYGIAPSQWAVAKAMAGCPTDDVEGIRGVGIKSACGFLKEILKEGSVLDRKIRDAEEIWKRNLPLVRLPYAGCPRFELREDEASPEKWDQLCRKLGMKSLAGALVDEYGGVRLDGG